MSAAIGRQDLMNLGQPAAIKRASAGKPASEVSALAFMSRVRPLVCLALFALGRTDHIWLENPTWP